MSEEEIQGLKKHTNIIIEEGLDSEDDIQSILKKWVDLYQQEKEKNKELNEYLITQSYEINRLNLDKIRLEMNLLPDTSECYKYLKHEYEMRLGRMNLEDYNKNYINKDKIRQLKSEIHQILDKNGITRGYQLIVDREFEKIMEEEE